MSVLATATSVAVLAQSPGDLFGTGQNNPVTSGHANTAPLAPEVQWSALVPLIILAVGALMLLTISSLLRGRVPKGLYAGYTVVVSLASILSVIPLWGRVQGWDKLLWWTLPTENRGPFSTLGSACTVGGSPTVDPGCGAVGVDGFSLILTVIIAASVLLGALLASDYLRREGLEGPELYVLMMLSGAGGVVMAMANDLIVLFLGLETLSIAVYVLAALHLKRIQSQEAGLKYFVLGAFSSAFFLYGIAMIYGATATTNLVNIKNLLATSVFNPIPVDNAIANDATLNSPLLLLGLGLILIGLGFKVAAVPFHFWSPDVYDGAPSPVVAYMASGVKAAGFAGLVRVFVLAFQAYTTSWRPLVAALAVLSMVVGSVLAIVQTNVKRTLAYSSISHAGFILMALQASTGEGNRAVVFYLITYTFMVAGSFGVVTVVSRRGDNRTGIDDYKGLARSNPGLALTFTVFLLAQAGVPFTSGFVAKLYTVLAAIDGDALWLAIVGMVSSVIAAFLYLRIIVSMFMGGEEGADAPVGKRLRVATGAKAALALCLIVTVGIGIFPGVPTDVSGESTPALVNIAEPPTTLPNATAGDPTGVGAGGPGATVPGHAEDDGHGH